MRRCIILVLLLVRAVYPQVVGEWRDVREVLDRVDRFMLQRNAAAIDKLLAPDYVEINPDDSVTSRSGALDHYTSRLPYKMLSIERDDAQITAHKGRAHLECHMVLNGKGAKGRFRVESRTEYEFQKIDGRWLLASSKSRIVRTVGIFY